MAAASGPPPDFFASDDESDIAEVIPADTISSEPALAEPSIPSSQTSNEGPPAENPLFLPDEEDIDYRGVPVERLRSVSIRPDAYPAENTDALDLSGFPQGKGPKPAARHQSAEVFRPNKRRKLSPLSDSDFTSAFLGSIVIANAWSTVKGKGYIKNGDPIFVEWDRLKQVDKPLRKSDKKQPLQKKGKQLTITALMKPREDNFKKKKQNDIVRLTNGGGFGELLRYLALVLADVPLRDRTITPERC